MFRELARKKQQLSAEECVRLLQTETRGVLSVLGDDDYPYGMPMNHWYEEEEQILYFHCGKQGHRMDALARHAKASFCVYDRGEQHGDAWALHVRSVIAFGRVEVISDPERIVDVTTKLSHKFTQDDAYIRKEIEQYANNTLLLALHIEHLCGKHVTES